MRVEGEREERCSVALAVLAESSRANSTPLLAAAADAAAAAEATGAAVVVAVASI